MFSLEDIDDFRATGYRQGSAPRIIEPIRTQLQTADRAWDNYLKVKPCRTAECLNSRVSHF